METELPGPSDIQRLLERFERAGWVKQSGRRSTPPYTFFVEWSEEGRDRITRVSKLLKKHRPELFDDPAKRCGLWKKLWMEWRLRGITRALRPPEYSVLEYRSLLGFGMTVNVDENGRATPVFHSDLE